MVILTPYEFLAILSALTTLCNALRTSSSLLGHKSFLNEHNKASGSSVLFEDNFDQGQPSETGRSTTVEKRVTINQGITRFFLPGVFEGVQIYWEARLELVYNLIPTQAAAQGLEAFYDAAKEVCLRQGHQSIRTFTIAIGAFTLDIYSRSTIGIPWLAIVAFLEEMKRNVARGLEYTFSGELEPVIANSLTGSIFWIHLRIRGLP